MGSLGLRLLILGLGFRVDGGWDFTFEGLGLDVVTLTLFTSRQDSVCN